MQLSASSSTPDRAQSAATFTLVVGAVAAAARTDHEQIHLRLLTHSHAPPA